MEKRATFAKQAVRQAILIVVSVIVIYPVLWVVQTAMTPAQEFRREITISSWSFDNFREVVSTKDSQGRWLFGRQLWNSLAVAAVTTLLGIFLALTGAYALSRDSHVRGDFIYRLWKPATQAKVELVLYFLFFFPGILALIISGWKYAERSWRYMEVSVNSPAGIPIFQFKTVIVAAGVLMLIQGIAQVLRCIICIRTGEWIVAAEDIEETEVQLARQQGVPPGHFASSTAREDGRGLKEEYKDELER